MSYYNKNDSNIPLIALFVLLLTMVIIIFSPTNASANDVKDFRGKPQMIYTEKIPPTIYYKVKYEDKYFARDYLGVEGEKFEIKLDQEEIK